MKNRVIILGAGFSLPAGVPNQSELMTKILSLNNEQEFINDSFSSLNTELLVDKELIQLFLKHLFKSINYEKISLEDLYTIIDEAILKKRNIGIFDLTLNIQVRESLDRLISFVVNKEINKNTINKRYIPFFENLVKNRNVSFISLNWDFLLEMIIFNKEYSIDYKIPLEVLPFQKAFKSKNRYEVLKPHGSLNWQLCPICELIYSDIDFSTQNNSLIKCSRCRTIYENSYSELKRLYDIKNITVTQRLMPLLISPTFIKENKVPHLNFIYQEIYKKLISAHEIVFIGYSLPISDHDIRNLLIRANSVNNSISIKVLLKENKNDIKKKLISNYSSIYGNNIDFYWDGFSKDIINFD